jgi:hypothetical protein
MVRGKIHGGNNIADRVAAHNQPGSPIYQMVPDSSDMFIGVILRLDEFAT